MRARAVTSQTCVSKAYSGRVVLYGSLSSPLSSGPEQDHGRGRPDGDASVEGSVRVTSAAGGAGGSQSLTADETRVTLTEVDEHMHGHMSMQLHLACSVG